MGMFFGTYQRNLDNKFRLQLPNKLVKEMPEHFYLLRGFEGALSIYEEKDFQKYLSSLEKMSFLEEKARTYMRLALSSVEVLDTDSHGRISLGSAIAKRYGLSSEVVIIGVLDHFEIWDKTSYEEDQKKNEDSYEKIAEDLSNLSKEEN